MLAENTSQTFATSRFDYFKFTYYFMYVAQTQTAYIGFGSNLGDLMQNLKNVQEKLAATQSIQVLRTSKLYRSAPHTLTPEKQPWYLNAVIEIKTAHSPQSLFTELKNIEQSMGR